MLVVRRNVMKTSVILTTTEHLMEALMGVHVCMIGTKNSFSPRNNVYYAGSFRHIYCLFSAWLEVSSLGIVKLSKVIRLVELYHVIGSKYRLVPTPIRRYLAKCVFGSIMVSIWSFAPFVLTGLANDQLLDVTPGCSLFFVGRNSDKFFIFILQLLLYGFYMAALVIVIILSMATILAINKSRKSISSIGITSSGSTFRLGPVIYDIIRGILLMIANLYGLGNLIAVFITGQVTNLATDIALSTIFFSVLSFVSPIVYYILHYRQTFPIQKCLARD